METHGMSLDWLLCGDLKGLQRMMLKRRTRDIAATPESLRDKLARLSESEREIIRKLVASSGQPHEAPAPTEEADPHAAGDTSSSTVPLTISKRYAAGLEIHRPGGALFQTGPCNPQHHFRSNRHAIGWRHHARRLGW
jgi:hypothetical protein